MLQQSLLLAVIASSVFEQVLSTDQKPLGQLDFLYYSQEAKDAAESVAAYLGKFGCSVDRLVEESKVSLSEPQQILLLENCVASIPDDYTTALRETVKNSLEKVQTIDIKLKANSVTCTSLRVPPPESCVQARQEAVKSLASAVSEQELESIQQVLNEAVTKSELYIEECLEINTSL